MISEVSLLMQTRLFLLGQNSEHSECLFRAMASPKKTDDFLKTKLIFFFHIKDF